MESSEIHSHVIGFGVQKRWIRYPNNSFVGTLNGMNVYGFKDQKYIDWVEACDTKIYRRLLPEELSKVNCESKNSQLSLSESGHYYVFTEEMDVWYRLRWN